MFDGKMLRELAGMPIRRTDLANSALALAEPEPLTLANLTTKSLTLVYRLRHAGPACVMSMKEFAHVPGAGRAALGAQAAMQADILVLDHDAPGLQRVADIEVLLEVERRRA